MFDGRLNRDYRLSILASTVMHTMRWHAHDKTGGTGHLYQGRFKSFPIQTDGHLLTVMRYVEPNPVRANFVQLSQDWQWSSAFARRQPADERRWMVIPDEPPLPRNWGSWVNKVETEAELNSLRHSVKRGVPLGDDQWTRSSAVRLGAFAFYVQIKGSFHFGLRAV